MAKHIVSGRYHIIGYGIMAGVALLTAATANAQTSTPTGNVEEQQATLEERRATILQNRASNTEARQERVETAQETANEQRVALNKRTQDRITNLAANLSNRHEGAIRRLTTIGDRLESRMNKLDAQNIDTTTAREHLTDARESLAVATNLLADVDTNVFTFVSSENPRERWFALKETYQSSREMILSARASLRAAVAALKTAVAAGPGNTGVSEAVSESDTATSTPNE